MRKLKQPGHARATCFDDAMLRAERRRGHAGHAHGTRRERCYTVEEVLGVDGMQAEPVMEAEEAEVKRSSADMSMGM